MTFLIITIGLLGLAALQVNTINDQFDAYQRAQVTVLVDDMADRLRLNADDVELGLYTATPSSPYGRQGMDSDCSVLPVAARDLCEWNRLLGGAAIMQNDAAVGGPLGALGCISLRPNSGAGETVVRVSVAWQGTTESVAPSEQCGAGAFGADTFRRVLFRDVMVR